MLRRPPRSTRTDTRLPSQSLFRSGGGRLSALALRPWIEAEQWLALGPMFRNPIARAFQTTAKLAGKQRAAIAAASWTMPRVQLQDILKEAMGIKELIRGGLVSLPEGIREQIGRAHV